MFCTCSRNGCRSCSTTFQIWPASMFLPWVLLLRIRSIAVEISANRSRSSLIEELRQPARVGGPWDVAFPPWRHRRGPEPIPGDPSIVHRGPLEFGPDRDPQEGRCRFLEKPRPAQPIQRSVRYGHRDEQLFEGSDPVLSAAVPPASYSIIYTHAIVLFPSRWSWHTKVYRLFAR